MGLFRAFRYIFLAIIVITLIRMVLTFLVRTGRRTFAGGPKAQQRPNAPEGGELVRDPVCGTFVSPAASIKKTVGGQVYYFCGVDCMNRYIQ